MRRTITSLLLVLICFGTALPFLQAQESSLPACCRRVGNHHCVEGTHSGPDGFRMVASSCPFRSLSVISSSVTALPTPRQRLTLEISSDSTVATASLHVALREYEHAYQRGPPLV